MAAGLRRRSNTSPPDALAGRAPGEHSPQLDESCEAFATTPGDFSGWTARSGYTSGDPLTAEDPAQVRPDNERLVQHLHRQAQEDATWPLMLCPQTDPR